MDGKSLRDDGTAAVIAAATAPHRTYKDYAVEALESLITSGRPFTSDDVHALIPEDVKPHSANVLPALIGSAASRRRIVPAGWIASVRPTRHASRNRMWIAPPAAREVPPT